MTREESIAELNRLGEEWSNNRDNLSTERRQTLAEKTFILAYELFPSGSKLGDMLGEFYIHYWDQYSSKDGALFNFMYNRLDYLVEARKHQDFGDHYVKNQKQDSDAKRIWISNESLSNPVGDEENGLKLVDSIPLKSEPDRLSLDMTMLGLISLILELPKRLKGKANNPQRLRYFRMFFTDSTVNVLQSVYRGKAFVDHERDLFQALCLGFLDFFMLRICRTASEIVVCPIKAYGQMVEGAPMVEPGHPFPNDIYLTYLRNVKGQNVRSVSTVSEMRQAYNTLLREANLC